MPRPGDTQLHPKRWRQSLIRPCTATATATAERQADTRTPRPSQILLPVVVQRDSATWPTLAHDTRLWRASGTGVGTEFTDSRAAVVVTVAHFGPQICHVCEPARVQKLRTARRHSADSAQIHRIWRWHATRLPASSGPALHELRTAASGTVCALSNCARALRDLSGAGRLPLGRRRLTTVRRAGVSGLSPLQLLGGWIRPVSLWRLRARSSGLSSFFVPDRGGMLWTFSTPPTILLLTRLL